GGSDGCCAMGKDVDVGEWLFLPGRKDFAQLMFAFEEDAFRHAIVQHTSQRLEVERIADAHNASAFDPFDVVKAGVAQNIGGLAGPRRLRADAWCDPDAGPARQIKICT